MFHKTYDTNINTAVEHRIGRNYNYSDFYLAEVHFIDGQHLLRLTLVNLTPTLGCGIRLNFPNTQRRKSRSGWHAFLSFRFYNWMAMPMILMTAPIRSWTSGSYTGSN